MANEVPNHHGARRGNGPGGQDDWSGSEHRTLAGKIDLKKASQQAYLSEKHDLDHNAKRFLSV
jgi:hypothetical protein